MDYYFVSRAKTFEHFELRTDVPIDGQQIVSRKKALPDGTPFFVDDHMRPLEPWCSFFFSLAQEKRSAITMRNYAYDLMALEEFLTGLEPPADLLSSTEDDLFAYRDYRVEHQDKPVSAVTWNRNRIPIKLFYEWAVREGLLQRLPYVPRRNGRDSMYLPIVKDLDVRHLTRDQWLFFHHVGLGGSLPCGQPDPEFRGQDRLRNMAAAELAVTTGLRLREFRALLDIEVGPPRPDRSPAELELQAIAKYGHPRRVTIQHEVLRAIDVYRRSERAIAVRHAARALQRRREHLFVVTDVDATQMKLRGRYQGRDRVFSVPAMKDELRRVTVIEGDHGLEPMALFVGRGGRVPGHSRWEQIFVAASKRAAVIASRGQAVVMPRKISPHDLRHTFAVYMLKILTQHQIHVEAERRVAGGHEAYLAEHMAVNPLLKVQELLGHLRPSSTVKYLRYIQDTNAIVAQAVREWTDADRSYADYADLIVGREVA